MFNVPFLFVHPILKEVVVFCQYILRKDLFHLYCRPHSTESFTHRKMTLSLADRSTKAQKVKVLPISGRDPDAHRSEMIKVKILNTCHFITCYFLIFCSF